MGNNDGREHADSKLKRTQLDSPSFHCIGCQATYTQIEAAKMADCSIKVAINFQVVLAHYHQLQRSLF